jgi:hypothetical protein
MARLRPTMSAGAITESYGIKSTVRQDACQEVSGDNE